MGCCSSRLKRKLFVAEYSDARDETVYHPLKTTEIELIAMSGVDKAQRLIIPIPRYTQNNNKINISINLEVNNSNDKVINEKLDALYASLPIYKADHLNEILLKHETEPNSLKDVSLSKEGYLSITSSCINGASNDYCKSYTNKDEQIGLVYDHLNKPIDTFALYIELFYLKIWKNDLLMSIYHDINLVISIAIDDNSATLTHIPFTKSSIDNMYTPLILIEESSKIKADKKSFSLLKDIVYDRNKSIHKIDIILSNCSNETCAEISKESIYFVLNDESQLKKIYSYQSIYSDYSNKKIANLHLEFIYALNTVKHYAKEDFEEAKSTAVITTVPFIEYLYLNVDQREENVLLSANNSSIKGGVFNSIVDIKKSDFSEELKQPLTNERLLEILPQLNTKFELFEVVKRLLCQASAFQPEKRLLLMATLSNLLETLNKLVIDDLLIKNIFKCLANCFEAFPCFALKGNTISNSSEEQSLLSELIRSAEICFKLIDFSYPSLIKYALMLLNKFTNEAKQILQISFNHNGISYPNISSYIYSFLSDGSLLNNLIGYITNDTSRSNELMTISIISLVILYSKQPNHLPIDSLTEELFISISNRYVNNSVLITNLLSLYTHYPSKANIDQLNRIFDIHLRDNPSNAIHDKLIALSKLIISDNSKKKYLTTEHIGGIIFLFSKSIESIGSKLQSMEECRLSNKDCYALLSYVYTSAKSINDINVKDYPQGIVLYAQHLLCDRLTKCFYVMILERNVFQSKHMTDAQTIDDIKGKTVLFRAIYNTMKLIQLVITNKKNSLSKVVAQKMLMITKKLQELDSALNPGQFTASTIEVSICYITISFV